MLGSIVLLLIGVLIHYAGPHVLHAVLPPAVTGAVVMLIGFNLAPVVADIYWPQDQWIALATMAFVIVFAVGVRGFLGRIAIFMGLIFGYLLFFADPTEGPVTQGMLMGSSTAVIALLLLLLAFFDHPHGGGIGRLQPTAMERTIRLIDTELEILDLDVPLPCDADGNPL